MNLRDPHKIEREHRWGHRVNMWIVFYFGVGFTFAIIRLFGSTGDLPNANSFAAMFRDLPVSLPDLVAATTFWVIVPAIFWPLTLAFTLMFQFSRLLG